MASNNQPIFLNQRRTLILFCLSIFLSVILVINVLHPIIAAISLSIIGYRFFQIKNKLKNHPTIINNILTIVVFSIVIYTLFINGFRNYLVNACINLLIGGICLKFLESNQNRDLVVQAVSLFFLSSITYIFHIEWYMSFYLLFCIAINVASMMSLFTHQKIKNIIKYSLKLTALTIPLAFLVFLVLPRFNPFWQIPTNTEQTQTGLGDEINFDSIQNLIEDNSLAFRVKFDGDIPKIRYFKSMIYPNFDPFKQSFQLSTHQIEFELKLTPFTKQDRSWMHSYKGANLLKYHLFIEPSNRRWIPTLEPSLSDSEQVLFTPMRTWVDRVPITIPKYYQFNYVTNANEYDEPPKEMKGKMFEYFTYSGYYKLNPKTRELVSRLLKEAKDDNDFAERVMNYFKTQNFSYRLNPLKTSNSKFNIYDDFLFVNKNGFCNHYSSTMVYMLRLANIPATVVGGFLGGEINDESNFVQIRNSDAHSWVYAYIDGKWKSFDPVSMIAPDRIFKAYNETIQKSELGIADINRYTEYPFIKKFKNYVESISFYWTSFIVNYNFDNENGFISNFFSQNTILATISLIMAIVLIIYISLKIINFLTQRKKQNPVTEIYLFYANLLSQISIKRYKYDTPLEFYQTVKKVLKDNNIVTTFKNITDIMMDYSYAQKITQKDAIRKLKKLKKSFKKDLNEIRKKPKIKC